jgi:predicted SAM-dependent methyltransferase
MHIPATLKKIGKKPFRPLWAGVSVRIEHRLQPIESRLEPIERRLAALESRLAALESRLAPLEKGWHQHVPSLLNAVSTVAAFGHELASLLKSADEANKNIEDLGNRIELIRKEIMFEFTYGERKPTSVHAAPARIISLGKVSERQAQGIKLNLGCGHIPLEDYINIDQRELPGVDIVADVGKVPFETESVHEIFSAHVLEHFPQERLRRLLSYWYSLLTPQGMFRAVVPDGEAMLAGVAEGSYPLEQFREVLFGAQEYDDDFHFNLLTPDSMTRLLSEAGFKKIEVPVKARRNGNCFEFEIRAIRGTA